MGDWIGAHPGSSAIAATLFVGVVGILFAGIGPLLLGGLQAAGRLSAAQIGQAGTAELLAMGLAAGLTGPLLGTARLRRLVIISAALMAALNLATMIADGWLLVLIRAANGLPSGALIWLTTALIVRAPRPERWAALYLTVQTLAQLLVVAALGSWVIARYGIDGGFAALALFGAAASVAGIIVPRAFAPLPAALERASGLPPPRGLLALAAAFALNAGILAVWIYVEPLSRQAGHPPHTADIAMSLSLAAQVAGGTLATLTASRFAWMPALLVAIVGLGAAVAVLALLPGAPTFLIASTIFGFLWMFAAPLMTPLAIIADPTRQAAAMGSGAALLGCSAGPLVTSLLVSDADVRGSPLLGIVFLALSAIIVAALRVTRPRHDFSGQGSEPA